VGVGVAVRHLNCVTVITRDKGQLWKDGARE
jgi:hypothetical protein